MKYYTDYPQTTIMIDSCIMLIEETDMQLSYTQVRSYYSGPETA